MKLWICRKVHGTKTVRLSNQQGHRKTNAISFFLYLVLVKYVDPRGCKHGQNPQN